MLQIQKLQYVFLYSVLSPQVEKFFRQVVAENKKSRENIEVPAEDYMQMLLNIGRKLGIFFLIIHSLPENGVVKILWAHCILFSSFGLPSQIPPTMS